MRFAIRRADVADVTGLVALEGLFPGDRLNEREFRHLLTAAHAEVWIAADGGLLLGNAAVLYRRKESSARLYSLVVAPTARRHGIARALIQTAESAATARAVQRMRLEVRRENSGAIHLYHKLGYRLVGMLPRFYEDGQDALRFEHLLPLNRSQPGLGIGLRELPVAAQRRTLP